MTAALLLLLAAPLAAEEPRITIVTDPRVELLSVVARLGAPAAPRTAYERAVDAWFSGYSTHPAVALLRRTAGAAPRQGAITEAVLSPARVSADTASGAGGSGRVADLLRALKEFAAASRFREFYASRAADYRGFLERAGAERSSEKLPPGRLAAYTGLAFTGELRLVLAPLLPEGFAVNLQAEGRPEVLRVRRASAPVDGLYSFGLGTFGAGAAHELAHVTLDPLAAAHASSLPGKAPDSCNGKGASWLACFQEQVVLAVTLRAAGRDAEPEMEGRLGDYPTLPALLERLKRFESERAAKKGLSLADRYADLVAAAPKLPAEPALSDEGPGVAAFRKDDYAGALKAFEAALVADPGDLDAHLGAGVACQKTGRPDCALAHYDAVIRLTQGDAELVEEPRLADALSSRATTLEALGRSGEARADLERALAAAPAGWARAGETRRRLEALR